MHVHHWGPKWRPNRTKAGRAPKSGHRVGPTSGVGHSLCTPTSARHQSQPAIARRLWRWPHRHAPGEPALYQSGGSFRSLDVVPARPIVGASPDTSGWRLMAPFTLSRPFQLDTFSDSPGTQHLHFGSLPFCTFWRSPNGQKVTAPQEIHLVGATKHKLTSGPGGCRNTPE